MGPSRIAAHTALATLLAACAIGPDLAPQPPGPEPSSPEIERFDLTGMGSSEPDLPDGPVHGDDMPCGWWSGLPGRMMQLDGVSPQGIAFGSDCALYVAMGDDDTVVRIGEDVRVFVDDPRISNIQGLDFGTDGHLYVASRDTDEILRFDGDDGGLLDIIVADDGLDGPNTVRFGPDGLLYVSSRNSASVLQLDHDRSLSRYVQDAWLGSPEGFAWNADGDVFVASRAESVVMRFDGMSRVVRGELDTDAELDSPEGVVFTPDGDLWVSSRDNGTVYRLDGGDYQVVETWELRNGGRPIGLAVGPDGDVYVSARDSGLIEQIPVR